MELVLPFWSLSGDFASRTTQRCRGGNKGGSVCPCQRKTQLAGSPTRAGSEACWAREQVDSERYAGQATGTWRTSWPDPLSRVVAHKWTRQTWSPPGAPTQAACVHKTHSETSTTLGCKLSNHYTVSTIVQLAKNSLILHFLDDNNLLDWTLLWLFRVSHNQRAL